VTLPDALLGKFPSAPKEWGWQWVFPARRRYVEVGTGAVRRHHLDASVMQRAVREAVRAAGHHEAGELPHLPALVRDASSGTRLRHPDRTGAPWPHGCPDDDDLHACPRSRGAGGAEPGGRPVGGGSLSSYVSFYGGNARSGDGPRREQDWAGVGVTRSTVLVLGRGWGWGWGGKGLQENRR
jgi:hypothetical protein